MTHQLCQRKHVLHNKRGQVACDEVSVPQHFQERITVHAVRRPLHIFTMPAVISVGEANIVSRCVCGELSQTHARRPNGNVLENSQKRGPVFLDHIPHLQNNCRHSRPTKQHQ